MIEKRKSIEEYPFEKSDTLHYFKTLFKDRKLKAFYQFLNRPHRRSYSRSLIKKYTPEGTGLEIGCGSRTICPTDRTVLSDAYSAHGVQESIARVFFKGDQIPYDNEVFSFVISEHVLEHIANPIKALKEWLRVLKKGGQLYCFLPHKDRNNDLNRKITTLQHLIQDFENDVPYNDPTHIDEWLENVVNKGLMPDHYRHLEKQELLDSASIHHHVWTEIQIKELFEYLDLEITHCEKKVHDRRDTFVVIATKK
jgi:SAM-dependent methyltransferase